MKKNIVFFSIAILAIIFLNTLVVVHFTSVRIGFVKSPELIDKYQATIDARNSMTEEASVYKVNLDTLMNEKSIIDSLMKDTKQGSREYLNLKEESEKKQEQIDQYYNAVSQITQEKSTKLINGVLNQINSFVYQYGKENGYDIIFATTKDGNILYGKDCHDLTEKILSGLNKNYKGNE